MTTLGDDRSEPDAAWARAHAPDLPLAALSDMEYDQHHFRRSRELQAEAAAEEQAMLRQLAALRQRLSKRIADQLGQLDRSRAEQAAELRRRFAAARERARAVEAAKEAAAAGIAVGEAEADGRGTGYGIEDTDQEAREEAERVAAAEAERKRVEAEREAAAEAAAARAKAEAERIAAAREEAEHAEMQRKMAELRTRKLRDRRTRDDHAAWRQRAANLDVAHNIRYVDVPWPVSGSSSSSAITSPAAINKHLASITVESARAFLAGVAEMDLELQSRKDAVLADGAGACGASTAGRASTAARSAPGSGARTPATPSSLDAANRRAVRDAIRVFHPDKFYHRVLPRVRQAERGKVREGVERTSRVLNDLLATLE